jgi:hypothetical protein
VSSFRKRTWDELSLTETWRKWDIHSLYGLLFTASFKSFVELRPVGGGGGEIKWLVRILICCVVLCCPFLNTAIQGIL